MKLADWLNEYRNVRPEDVIRPVAEPDDDWVEEDLFAPADRVRSTEPRWKQRASSVGYGRATQI